MLLSLSCRQKTAGRADIGTLRRALLVSAGLHALLLLAAWPLPGGSYQPLVARLGAATAPAGIGMPEGLDLKPQQTIVVAAEKKTGSPPAAPAAKKSAFKNATTLPVAATPQAPLLSLAEGLDSNGLTEFRLDIARQAYRFRPQLAHLRGRVEARVGVAASGRLLTPELVKSSGQAALDTAVMEMLRQALMQTHVPASLLGKDFSVLVPVEVGTQNN